MKTKSFTTIDASEAVARVAYALNEVIAIYPITPSSNMGEWADEWSAAKKPNLWGTVPMISELQSEAGVAGAVHGALQTGALTTTFTASQGLLLMIPNMYKIAGELTPTVFHVAARSVATHALSIFGDHSDVMAARQTGFALLCSASVQEAMDFAVIAQKATLESRIPFIHFFDGFRTSHEVSKIEIVSDEDLRAMIEPQSIARHRAHALSPDHPVLRGTAQNPDVYFQAREAVNPYYLACSEWVEKAMLEFGKRTGRRYSLFEYHGSRDAERMIVLMGSGCETVHEIVDHLIEQGERVGVLKVRLYRPFNTKCFVGALPETVRSIAVLDRTKEPGSAGEPLYLDCLTAIHEEWNAHHGRNRPLPRILGGRYGLSSKEFTPGMVKGIFEHLKEPSSRVHFTIGIQDDVTHTSIDYPKEYLLPSCEGAMNAIFYGLGSDGTVGANKNSIKIIGENTSNYAQGYFVYDSKKSGSLTVSHLRFGPHLIRSPYLIAAADFIACHQPVFLNRYDVLKHAASGGIFLLNTPHKPETIWRHLPTRVTLQITRNNLKFYIIDADRIARETKTGRINTVMQVCFFAITGILPLQRAIEEIKKTTRKTYGRKGDEIVERNLAAVDQAIDHLIQVEVGNITPLENSACAEEELLLKAFEHAPAFVAQVLGKIIAGCGDDLPVSLLPVDGTFPTNTAKWEKRNLASEIPVWDPDLCIQCAKCIVVCPHSAIRMKAYEVEQLKKAPSRFQFRDARSPDWKGKKFTIQVAPEDCTGCAICVDVCPVRSKQDPANKALNMRPLAPLLETERFNWEFFLSIPPLKREQMNPLQLRQQQAQEPLFEFPGACAGCGETPYLKLISQLFGDRMLIANATGCSSIYGGNLPTTPWSQNAEGRGPAWSNSLFENNAEFGLGFRLSLDKQQQFAAELLQRQADVVGENLVRELLHASQETEADIYEQRERVARLKEILLSPSCPSEGAEERKMLLSLADALVKKSVWIVGGDGWAYDIGFGGLDHVIASGKDVNILVLDTEVYSNTGGQMSKATPCSAIAKFAAGGKAARKKDLGLIAMSYGSAYVAQVALGARDEHTLKVFVEAESYRGPSLIIAYSHCIAHGIQMNTAMHNQRSAVQSGHWLLYRYDPRKAEKGENPLQLDSPPPREPLENFLKLENRFRGLTQSMPEQARHLHEIAQHDVDARWQLYSLLASREKRGMVSGVTNEIKRNGSESSPQANVVQPLGAGTVSF